MDKSDINALRELFQKDEVVQIMRRAEKRETTPEVFEWWSGSGQGNYCAAALKDIQELDAALQEWGNKKAHSVSEPFYWSRYGGP